MLFRSVRLGSGLDSDVLKLSLEAPNIRVCMPETDGVGPEVRVRYGRAELTDEGPTPIQGDAFETRGARGRMLGLGSGTIKSLAAYWREDGTERSLMVGAAPGWLRLGRRGLETVSAGEAQAAFGADVVPEDLAQVWVYVDMDSTQLDVFAALMASSEEDAACGLDSEAH